MMQRPRTTGRESSMTVDTTPRARAYELPRSLRALAPRLCAGRLCETGPIGRTCAELIHSREQRRHRRPIRNPAFQGPPPSQGGGAAGRRRGGLLSREEEAHAVRCAGALA